MQEINAWLKSEQDFNEGVCLYQKYGANTFFIKILLSDGPTQYNIDKLGAELESLAPALPAIIDIPKKKINTNPTENKQAGQTHTPPLSLADQQPASDNGLERYLGLKELLKTTYRQIERNMAELDLNTKESLLHLTAKNILSLHQKTRDIYKLLDHYDEHGKFPVVKNIEVVRTPAEEIQLLRQSTSKAKTRLKSKTCRDRTETENLIEANNRRIIELGGKVKS